ncbi:MAG: hypothetical protein ACREGI_01200 [Candidatus Levyibacteriota bacterium]
MYRYFLCYLSLMERVRIRPQVEKFVLPEGNLFVPYDLPIGYPSNFAQLLIAQKPWVNSAEQITTSHRVDYDVGRNKLFRLEGQTTRKISRVLAVGGLPALIMKQSHFSLGQLRSRQVKREDARATKKRDVTAFSPSRQFIINATARERYKREFGEELPLERLVGAFVSRDKSFSYLLYENVPDITSELTEEQLLPLYLYAMEVHQRLNELGVHTGAEITRQFIATSPTSFLLIDTEDWSIMDEPPAA